MTDANPTVAVLGTGIMGAPMARNAAQSGLAVRAWNRSRDKAEALAGDGVEVVSSPADAVRGADLVVTMLSDTDAVAGVMNDAAAGLGEGIGWVQMSTVGLEGTARLADLAGHLGVRLLDAPVSGTKAPAEKGALVVLASGDEGVREEAAPFLDAVGSKTVWLGPEVGRATRMKLVLNTWVLELTEATAEVLALARALGLEGADVLSTLEGGPLDSAYLQMKGKMMLAGEYPASFPLTHAHKDLHLLLEAAQEGGVGLPAAEGAENAFHRAEDAGHGGEDMSAVFEAVKPGG
jgi:3-hydroxyisobutyrate dehydrogenase